MHLKFFRRRINHAELVPAVELMDQLDDARRYAEVSHDPEVVIDLSLVAKINSQDLGELVKFHLDLSARERRLVLDNPQCFVAEILEVTRLYRLIEVRSAQPV